jgi:hypothetical protein
MESIFGGTSRMAEKEEKLLEKLREKRNRELSDLM